jgi:hypothetical protein
VKEPFRGQQVIELYRPQGEEHPLPALAAVLAASADWGLETAFDRVVEEEGTRRVGPVDERWLRQWVAGIADPFRREVFGGLVLCTSADPPLTFSYRRDIGYGREVTETVRIAIPWRPRPAWATTERVAAYLETVAHAYGAPVSTVIPYDLNAVLAWAAARFRGLEADLPDVGLPESALAPFLTLLPRAMLDRTAVPECVGWMNFWTAPVVESIGRDRILAQRWYERRESEGGLLLVASADPPVREHPEAIAKVAQLVADLALGKVQSE